MSKYSYDARAYDDRYRRVYDAGADYWEEPVPTEALARFLFEKASRLLKSTGWTRNPQMIAA